MDDLNSLKNELEKLKAELLISKTATDSKKLVINGSFGKFGSKYSTLYSPDLLIQTTVTGQLALLMLIEAIEKSGVAVVSANTDGVVIVCQDDADYEKVNQLVFLWEISTGYETEETRYESLHSDNVNNYMALTSGGGYKGKGRYASAGLMKNPNNLICVEAVAKYLLDGVGIAETIIQETDITKFVTIRTVKGGAVKDDVELGKAIRWYYSATATGSIHYLKNNNRVPRSEGAQPMMNLPDVFPADLNHSWYINEAEQMLIDMGVNNARKSDRECSSEVRQSQRDLNL